MGWVQTQVEELPENKVRLSVEVPSADVQHAVEHAAGDLAASMKIPGFRKGKVPMPVLLARVGKERVYSEAVESHIGGWFRNAAVSSRIRPVEAPEYNYELPDDSTAKVEVTVNELKEKVLPPLDDDLARAASEFDSLEELRADIERRLREQIEEEVEGVFRAAAVDSLVESSGFKAEGAL